MILKTKNGSRVYRYSLPTVIMLFALGLGHAFAADAARVAVPNVVGQSLAEAQSALEAAGFQVRSIEVAGIDEGRVGSQNPKAGTQALAKSLVTLNVGLRTSVKTVVPDVRGKFAEEALAELSAAYVVKIKREPSSAAQAGKVIRTTPGAGSAANLRSTLTLTIGYVSADDNQPATKETSSKSPRPTKPIASSRPTGSSDVPETSGKTAPKPLAPGKPAIDSLPPPRVSGGTSDALPGSSSMGRMPNIRGKTAVQAEREVIAAGLTPHPWFVKHSASRPWTVVGQQIRPGLSLPEGAVVQYRVVAPSDVRGTFPMPRLIGLSERQARNVLRGLGMTLRRSPESSATGLIRSQVPSPGQQARFRAPITVDIRGEGMAQTSSNPALPALGVITVVGKSREEAVRIVQAAGLVPDLRQREEGQGRVDHVLQQIPSNLATAKKGSTVKLVFPRIATVPDVVGRTVREAGAVLSQARLATRFGGGTAAAGSRVTSQVPRAGSTVASGSTVQLRVTGDPTLSTMSGQGGYVTVPDVRTLTRSQAANQMANAGLQAVFADNASVVGHQSYAPGAIVQRGTQITLSSAGVTYPAQPQPGTVYPGTTYPGTTYPGTTQPGTTTYPGTTAQPAPPPRKKKRKKSIFDRIGDGLRDARKKVNNKVDDIFK